MSNERDELLKAMEPALFTDAYYGDMFSHDHNRSTLADAILAAGYRKPQQVTTEEELDALPPGSVVLSLSYLGQPSGQRISFQRWPDGDWHRGARSGSTHPDNFLPATVLHVGGTS